MSRIGSDIAVGNTIGAYRVTRNEPMDNLGGSYIELEHVKTGSKHVHVAVPDDNKGLAIVFPTVPQDSTGIAHILEHLALAGSKNFPGKDPFSTMLSRSLQTMMNAFTADDHTLYLFSTRNQKDFYNLATVYLDSAFYPLLRELSFKQEGHRLEFEDPTDPNSGLRYKGVVFNETKGYVATLLRVANEAIGTALFPDLTYAFNSGGDPAEIPNLTHEAIKEFYASHYHPSNARFVSYGDLDLTPLLDFIDTKVLQHFERSELDVSIPDQKRFSEPVELRVPYPLSKDESKDNKAQVLLAWATTKSANSFEVLGLKILEEVLLGNAASPVKKALIDSRLGEALFDWGGLRTDYREAAFVIGLKGTNAADATKVEALVLETLEGLVKDGIDQSQVDAAIHQLEISSREISNNPPYPYAIRIIQEIAQPLVHGADPYPLLQLDAGLKRLEIERKSGQFFEDMIRRYFLDNPHRALIIVEPDQELEDRWKKAEMAKLAEIEAQLTDQEKARIVEEAAQLQALQDETVEDVLPRLELSDVPMTFEDTPHEIEVIAGAKVAFFPQPTNGLTYIDVRADFSTLPNRLKERLGIFATAVTKSGVVGHDYLQMARRINTFTGGITAAASTRVTIDGVDNFRQGLAVSGKSLVRNNSELTSILGDILSSVTFDAKRLKEVIAEQKAKYDSEIVFASTSLAIILASSKLSKPNLIDEQLGGVTYYTLLRELASKDEDLEGLVADLETIKDHLFRSENLEVCITSQEDSLNSLKGQIADLLGRLDKGKASESADKPLEPNLGHEAKTLAVPVNSNVKVIHAVDYGHPDSPALLVLSQFMSDKYLHRELREKGGAYGAQAVLRRESGDFIMLTAQDPNVERTYRTFDEALKWVIDNTPPAEEVTEAILSACNLVDPLLAPDTKGRARFFSDLAGYTLDKQEAYKKRLLEVTPSDLQRVAAEHLADGTSALASIGNPEAIAKGSEELGNIFEISPV